MDQYNRIEAISAVADDAFLVEEDDDYEDLYNDVNVGEGFLQSMRKNDEAEAGSRNEEQQKVSSERSKENVQAAPNAPERQVLIPGVVTGGIGAQGFSGSGVPGGSVAGNGVELEQASSRANAVEIPIVNNNSSQGLLPSQHIFGNNEPMIRPGVSNVNGSGTVGNGGVGTGGGTILFVGDLHWWTTDAELEAELCKYGTVKEVKFFDEKATGKSKGYCQVEFYDSMAATACKEGLDGHIFNGKPCVVAFASPYNVKRMGEAQVNKRMGEIQSILAQAKKGGPIDPPNKPPATNNITPGGNHQGGDGRGFGRGNWGRGNAQGMVGRGQVGPLRNRPGGMGGRGLMGNGGGGFGQGIGSGFPMMHPQSMMGQGFDPAFGGPMARMGSYGGFPGAPAPPFLPSFPHVGLPGVAPHVNPAFFGRGMPMNAMGMVPNMGVDRGPNMGMWDPNTGGWGGNRAAESSYGEEARSDHQYGEEATSDHQYGEVNKDRGSRPKPMKEKDRAPEREWSASSDRRNRDEKDAGHERGMSREKDVSHSRDWPERRHRDDRDAGRERHNDRERSRVRDREKEKERDHHREERERYGDHRRLKDEPEHDKEWDSGRSSRAPSKSRLHREDNHRSRSKEADYGKRRRLTSE